MTDFASLKETEEIEFKLCEADHNAQSDSRRFLHADVFGRARERINVYKKGLEYKPARSATRV